ncbi:hypothetical protein F7725_025842 [Dissostichus mawsoni]|uniref:Uncharacterized protein n=1 Tax=Dissostichus mawsoni TaxID=36200 RepID=A0A7J5X679_DISMA|nr:hypothetical protein F7725_025842 [Dissostichus mawsoni]
MLICDGSTVLMQSMAYHFCGVSLQELLSSAAKNYHLAMHVFGLMTQATTMSELDEVVTSAVVVFSSSHSDRNVGKHFENLQGLLTNSAQSNLDDSTIVEDCVNDIGPTPFKQHFEDLITQTVIEKSGDDNMYFCPTFIPSLLKYFLPLAGLWSGLLLELHRGQQNSRDNGKKPVGPQKDPFSTETSDQAGRFCTYIQSHLSALLREYGDSLRRGKKTHRVDMERWKQRKQNRRGVYVTPINKPFVFRQHKKNLMQNTKTAKAPAPLQKQVPGSKRQGKTRSIFIHIKMTEHAEDDAQGGKGMLHQR